MNGNFTNENQNNNKYLIGIDLGVSSCGWSIIKSGSGEIIKAGSALFNNSNDAKGRRGFRAVRRLKKRKLHRIERLAVLLNENGINPHRTIDEKLIFKRKQGLTEKISLQDIINIIYYFSIHRGYIPFDDEKQERETYCFKENEYPCDYYISCLDTLNKYRNNEKQVKLEDNIREFKAIMNTQKKYYKEINDELIEKIITIIKSKRKFYEGPGGIREDQLSPYGRVQSLEELEDEKNNPEKYKYLYERLIGECRIAKGEKKAPIFNYYAEKFNFLNDIINMHIKAGYTTDSPYFNKNGKLTKQGVEKILDYVFTENITLKRLVKLLDVNEDILEGYRVKKDKTAEFSNFEFYKAMLKEFSTKKLSTDWITSEDKTIYNQVVYIMTVIPSSTDLESALKERMGNHSVSKFAKRDFSDSEIKSLEAIMKKFKSKFSFHSLSEKVLRRALADMEKSDYALNYMQIMKRNNYEEEMLKDIKENYSKQNKPPYLIESKYVDEIIANPQVKKSLRKAMKIINTIIIEQGDYPESICIESAKEMNSKEKKKKIEQEQIDYEKKKKNAEDFLEKHNYVISLSNIRKMMAYQETNGECIYCGKKIPMDKFFELEIEHILPISKSCDDSFDNITCSCLECNKNKGQRTPFQFKNSEHAFSEFKRKVENLNISEIKKQNLLYDGDIDKDDKRFINRNLRDTAYETVALIEELKKYNYWLTEKLGLENKAGGKINIVSIPGQLTTTVRTKMNLDDKDRSNPLHHAVDATIIASIINTEGVGNIIARVQNDPTIWINKNKNEIFKQMEFFIKYIQLKNISEIKKLRLGYDSPNYTFEDYDKDKYVIKRSYEVYKDPKQSISHDNIIKVIEKNGQTYAVDSFSNIYEIDFSKKRKAFEETLYGNIEQSEKAKKKMFLCALEDKKTYQRIVDIYEKYKDEKGNPFKNYCLSKFGLEETPEKFNPYIHGIRKYSKLGNGPIIKTLKYISVINNPYFINKKSANAKKNNFGEFVVPDKKEKTKIALESLSQYCTEIYKEKEIGKFIFMPIAVLCINKKGKDYDIDYSNEYYKKEYKNYIGNKNVVYVGRLYNGNMVRIYKKTGEVMEGIFSGTYRNNYKDYLKIYLDGIKDSKAIQKFHQLDLRIIIYNTNILGKRYKTIDSDEIK